MYSLTRPSLSARLGQQFNVLKTFNMDYYMTHLDELYTDLLSIRKEKFEHNDRIVFMFNDTDYYFVNYFGLGLYNTYKIINYLNIPTFCCLFVTQQDYIKKDIQQLNKKYFSHDTPINVVEIYIDTAEILSIIKPTTLNISNIKKHFTYLSGQNRKHRAVFYSLLDKQQLLDLGQISFRLGKSLNEIEGDIHGNNDLLHIPNSLELVIPRPITLCNENWILKNNTIAKIFDNFILHTPNNFVFKNFVEEAVNNTDLQPANPDLIQNTFLYIAAETMFEYPGTFISEKSLKGIACMRPFVMLGPPHNLKKLHDYGFKTFNKWWNEDYDSIIDNADRLASVFNLVEHIAKKPISELKEICNDMSEVLHYNYHHLTNNFVRDQLELFDKQCLESNISQ